MKNIVYMQYFSYICKEMKLLTSGCEYYGDPGVGIVQIRV